MSIPSNKRTDIDDSVVIARYLSGETGISIAKDYRISFPNIYARLEKAGIKRRSNSEAHKGLQTGDQNSFWKGGKSVSRGYVTLFINGKNVLEHRIIAAGQLGRPLLPGEVVHHKKGKDNNPDNLLVLPSQSAHMKLHITPEEASRRALIGREKRRAQRHGRIRLALNPVQAGLLVQIGITSKFSSCIYVLPADAQAFADLIIGTSRTETCMKQRFIKIALLALGVERG